MKRAMLCLIVLLAAGLFAVARAEASTTLLVYMCGADLQSDACEDIYEMAQAQTGDEVNVLILAGGSPEWDYQDMRGGTRNLISLRNGDFEYIEDWGWMSMGSGDCLLQFLEYGLTRYPAERTMVVLWDHGAGSEGGICFDMTTRDEDGLTLLEINDALTGLKARIGDYHIDVFGCDACMMATYEMAAMLSCHDIDCFVASEELETVLGWHYTPWLKQLQTNPGIATPELCKQIVDSYMQRSLAENARDYLTLSVVDLKGIAPLQQAMERFAAVLMGQLEQGNVADVSRGRSQMYAFGSFVDGSWDMVDMGAMLDAYAMFDAQQASQARNLLKDAVLYSRQTDNLNPCCGLSVLIPQDTKNEFEAYCDGMDLSFVMPNWIGFVKAFAGQLTAGSHNFSNTTAEQVSNSTIIDHVSDMYSNSTTFGWDEQEGEYAPTQPDALETAFLEGDYAFTAKLSAEDLRYLDYVEGMLMIDISDEEMAGYVDLGLMRNNLVDWNTGDVYSLFDGTWPVFGDQLVPLYDQISNERSRRSLIPVKLNGEYTYLVVEFAAGESEGRIIGANAGYGENGLPIRATTPLEEGDSIVPVYTMLVDGGGEEMEEQEFDGDEIIWHEGMTVTYENLSDEEDPIEMLFCFVLNDVFGNYTTTEPTSFEL